MALQTIKYKRGDLQILDQLKLPHAEVYEKIKNCQDAWYAIKEMRTRGAPAIAIVASLALAVELQGLSNNGKLSQEGEEVSVFIHEKLDYLVTSRPTAVNLADAARKLKKAVQSAAEAVDASGNDVRKAYVKAAERMLIDDVADNEAIGGHGAEWILGNTRSEGKGQVGVLTHCNTGSLATAGYGTALGVIRSIHASGSLAQAYCTETRPYNQGSRLTAFELVHDKIPSTLITDSMAGALLSQKQVAAIVVGADRVVANGDTANKIGTYSLAVLARYHSVKFLVAAPRTTIDLNTERGADIVIEKRPGKEVTMIKGLRHGAASVDLGQTETVSIAADGINVWNPAFDVTPADLIDGIVTEVGVAEKDSHGNFNLARLFEWSRPNGKPATAGDLWSDDDA